MQKTPQGVGRRAAGEGGRGEAAEAVPFGTAFFPVSVGASPPRVTAAASLSAASGADLRGLGPSRAAPPVPLRRAGAPQQPLAVFPPVFDTRLYYRFAHEPYEIEDQEDCASCVFIAAATCAKVRGGVQSDLPVMNAARLWRQLLREEGGDEASAEAQSYRRAAGRFSEVMCARARAGAGPRREAASSKEVVLSSEGDAQLLSPSARALPLLDWRRFICCGGSESHEVCGSRSRPEQCYHHRDGDPREAAFHCARHSEGVVPLHFVEWLGGVGLHCRAEGSPVVETISPERAEGFALTAPVQVDGELGEAEARAMAEQVRLMKTSLLTHGPLMAMMKIDGRSFDAWGGSKAGAAGRRSGAARVRGAARGGGAGRAEARSGEGAEAEAEARSGEGAEARRGEGAEAETQSGEDPEEAPERSGASSSQRRRAGYVLPSRDSYDEFHEVTVVGWSFDDDGVPCWVVLNSYGESYNDACVPSGGSVSDPWLSSLLEGVASRGYVPSGISAKGGAVFVRMMSPETLQEGRSTDMENNVIAFIPHVASGSRRAGAPAPRFYDPMGKRVHVTRAGGGSVVGERVLPGGSSGSWVVGAGVAGLVLGVTVWSSLRELKRR